MLTLQVDEVLYNKLLHDILRLSELMKEAHKTGDEKALVNGLKLLCDVRECMLEIIANND